LRICKAVERDRDRLALANPPADPSFNCAAAGRSAEKAICSDTDPVRLDRDMNAAYRAALVRL
jgi:uncharacterized protein